MKILKTIKKVLRTIYWSITVLAMISALTVATYAWFTSNHTVTTNTATTRTDTATLTLEISEQGGNAFKAVDTASIIQVNQTKADYLLPVSTSDLKNFVYNPSTVSSQAQSFAQVTDEQFYYHGRIYLRARADGMPAGSSLALYLDQAQESGGSIVSTTDDGALLSAGRLGLAFSGPSANSVIFRFTDGYNSSGATGNTFLNGTQLTDAEVLSWNGRSVTKMKDPSVTLDTYTLQLDGTQAVLPAQPLIYMTYNQIYQVDVYFYIEGCDPDCTDSIYYDGGDLHLAFYGMLSQGGR